MLSLAKSFQTTGAIAQNLFLSSFRSFDIAKLREHSDVPHICLLVCLFLINKNSGLLKALLAVFMYGHVYYMLPS